jgi:hypothetical protein
MHNGFTLHLFQALAKRLRNLEFAVFYNSVLLQLKPQNHQNCKMLQINQPNTYLDVSGHLKFVELGFQSQEANLFE